MQRDLQGLERSTQMEDTIKNMIMELGADACGIASLDRFAGTAWDIHPVSIFPAARSVVVFLRRIPRSFVLTDSLIAYQQVLNIVNRDLDRIALNASLNIERMGAGAMPVPAEKPYAQWNATGSQAKGLIDLRHAAVYAGLGQIGRGALFINPHYGNFVNIGAVITNLNLRSDPAAVNLCIPDCHLCEESCPAHALKVGHIDAEKCRAYSVGFAPDCTEITLCNTCRVICPVALGESG